MNDLSKWCTATKSSVKTVNTTCLNGPFSRTTWVSRYQKSKTNLDFTEAKDSEWQWHYLGHMQVCTSHQTDNHASTPPLSFLQAGCPSCRPTSSVKALKANNMTHPSSGKTLAFARCSSGRAAPFDVVGRLGDEESLEVEIDLDARLRVDGDRHVDAVVAGDLNRDQQQVQLDETEPVHIG